jgi:hypothetical protein
MTVQKPVYMPMEFILNNNKKKYVSLIFKKISPKTFGPHRVYRSFCRSLLNTTEIKRRHIQTQATQMSLIFMKTEAAVCMIATFIINCPLQLVQMDFSLLAYLSIIKLSIWFYQVPTWIRYVLVTEYVP